MGHLQAGSSHQQRVQLLVHRSQQHECDALVLDSCQAPEAVLVARTFIQAVVEFLTQALIIARIWLLHAQEGQLVY